MKISVVKADLTKIEADVIVNAANEALLPGGGVSGAIHKAAGKALYEECQPLAPIETGETVLTKGYNLPAPYVIHTVGPVWQGGGYGEEALLARCYRNSLELAEKNGLRTVAFPSISTGIFRFPLNRAAKIAIQTIQAFLDTHDGIDHVYMVCFDLETHETYLKYIEN
jgi:O-acetyl-ADP-ribose deacetylase (regulator of RNase III)